MRKTKIYTYVCTYTYINSLARETNLMCVYVYVYTYFFSQIALLLREWQAVKKQKQKKSSL